ncbi:energy-coupling factor ABC transporter permease [Bradyrhizobium sp. 162]|uniref:energy-coupling factor ABC transporter permease n=1 Tax=Bradyrhizobium sp. 162 TaxID=2782635 RepID=UPI001FFC07BB|nr:cobalt ABC transporter permease [Bradyrhizobium sp. 162]
MHIEPGMVTSAKFVLSCATGIAMGCVVAKLVVEAIHERRALSFAVQAIAAAGLVFTLFEFLPHFAVWASEVHLVLGSTLFPFGAAPAALGLALGLLLQSVLFVPTDLPQYRMNVTTPLMPLFAIKALAKRLIPSKAAYRDLQYSKALALSTAYQSGIAVWIASLALYRAGFGAANLGKVALLAVYYAVVALVEPLADLAALALGKQIGRRECEGICRLPLPEGMLRSKVTMAAISAALLKRYARFPR